MSHAFHTTSATVARRPLGALLAVVVLALIGPAATARIHFPSTTVIGPFGPGPRRSSAPGYLPSVGSPALRWQKPPPAAPEPTAPPLVLYAPPAPPSGKPEPTPTTESSARATAASEAKPALKPEDFLPFFQHNRNAQPANANSTEGLQFTPARPALPSSGAEYHQQ